MTSMKIESSALGVYWQINVSQTQVPEWGTIHKGQSITAVLSLVVRQVEVSVKGGKEKRVRHRVIEQRSENWTNRLSSIDPDHPQCILPTPSTPMQGSG